LFAGADFSTALGTDLYRHFGEDSMADVGDALVGGPILLLDGILTCTNLLSGRSAIRTWKDEGDRRVTARLLDIRSGPRKERIFTDFMQPGTERERKYLGNCHESRTDTVGFRDGTQGADFGVLEKDQRKIFWDVLCR
jgi:hypothetical protein